jgi:hypothetical protein
MRPSFSMSLTSFSVVLKHVRHSESGRNRSVGAKRSWQMEQLAAFLVSGPALFVCACVGMCVCVCCVLVVH